MHESMYCSGGPWGTWVTRVKGVYKTTRKPLINPIIHPHLGLRHELHLLGPGPLEGRLGLCQLLLELIHGNSQLGGLAPGNTVLQQAQGVLLQVQLLGEPGGGTR